MVTGASRGIGRAVCERLAREGWRVIGLSRTPPEGEFPGDWLRVDLADEEATREVFTRIAEGEAPVGFVHDAGIFRPGPAEAIGLADLRAMQRVHVEAAVLGLRAFVPAMKARGFGRIVLIGSRAALGKPGRAAYGATKAALVGLARTAALELAPHGITVNVVAPGPIDTDMLAPDLPRGSPERERFARSVPVGRFGRPEEVAAAVAFFAGREASFVTGQLLYVCGGASVGTVPL